MKSKEGRTLVIVPTYNERQNIETLADRLFDSVPEEVDLLVVDDGSPDGTAELVGKIGAKHGRIHLIERTSKQGLGASKLEGIRWALARNYTAIVEMDGDLSHDPTVVPELVKLLDEADLVIGSRYVPGGGITKWSLFRRALSKGGNAYQRFMLGAGVRDGTSGFRAYRSSILRKMTLDEDHLEGFGFLIEMVRRVHLAGGRIKEHPIFFAERRAGESKIDREVVFEALKNVTKWGISDRLASPRRRG
jgi:dolichol-phosphate mannosyltransferase